MSMKYSTQTGREAGVALVIGLLLLFILTVLGISAYNSAHVQERGAGNMKFQSMSFEAASAGASKAIAFFADYRASHGVDLEDEECGAAGHEGWEEPTPWLLTETIDGVEVSQRLYCLADQYPCVEGDPGCEEGELLRPPRSQLFVLSRGHHPAGSERFVEVRLTTRETGGGAGDGCGALCFPGCDPGEMDFPSSLIFRVDGDGGYAVTGGCQDMVDAIDDSIRDSRIDNYIGGVGVAPPGPPWNDPTEVEQLQAYLKAEAQAADEAGTCQTLCYFEGNYSQSGEETYGDLDDPQITYIEGDLYFGGMISGAGILVVDGDLTWYGTPEFQGLILVLGGTYYVEGGAHGGNHAGSVVILNTHDEPADPDHLYGPSALDNTGGGVAQYNYDCDVLLRMREELMDISAQGLWNPECNAGPEDLFDAEPSEIIIASWRENLGWREAMIAD